MAGKFKYTNEEAVAADQLLRSQLEVVTPIPLAASLCRDQDDDWILATAIAGNVACVVTGDKDLLALGQYEGIVIVRPSDFVDFDIGREEMAIPVFDQLTLPLLRIASDGQEYALADLRAPIADIFALTDEERKELLPSGQQPRFNNRLAWAKVYLERAGLLSKTRRGHFRITPRGNEVLASRVEKIDMAFLRQFPEFSEFQKKSQPRDESASVERETPEETLQASYQKIRQNLAADLVEQIRAASPAFFERLVLDVMIAMGYGGSHDEAGSLTNAGPDAGIDGIINEDQLGLDVIYLQAKRWENTVGRPEIQKFVGALHGKRAKKGVFLTTSNFSSDALEYVATIDPKVVLIDGNRLAELMIDFNVGVSTNHIYEIKRTDSDYFAED